TLQRFVNVAVDPGHYETYLFPTGPLALPGDYTYVLTAKDDQGNKLVTSTGGIHHALEIDGTFPVAHIIVDGVDIWHAHLPMSAQDVLLRGRGLSLDFTRTYSSAGDSSAGPLGAGWTHSYNVKLIYEAHCGTLTVVGGEGSGNAFDTSTGHSAASV